MRHIIKILSIALLLYTGASKGYYFGSIPSNAVSRTSASYHLPADQKKGLLETTKITMGTIYKSHHFNNKEFNETHNGIYLSAAGWSLGTFENSGNAQSVFVTYNPEIYRKNSLEVNLVTGVANGYEDWKYSHNGMLPVVGVSARWMNLKTMVSPDAVAFGLELPLN